MNRIQTKERKKMIEDMKEKMHKNFVSELRELTSKKTEEEICTNCGKLPDKNIQEIKILEKEREKIVKKAKKNGHKDGELIFKYLDETDYHIWNTISNKITKLKTLAEVEKIIELSCVGYSFGKEPEFVIWYTRLLNKLGEMKK